MTRASTRLAAIGAAGVMTFGLAALATPAQAATPYPTTLTATAPSTVTYGSSGTVLGHLVLAGTPFGLSGEKVALYQRASSTAAWSLVTTHTTDARGNTAFVVRPLHAEQYLLRHPADQYTTSSSSAAKTVRVAWRVTANLTKTSVAPKAADAITATVAPNAKGMTVTLQRKSGTSWTTVATKTLSGTSTASFTFVAPSTAAKYDYRVVKAASSLYATGVSAILVLTVT